MGRGALMGALAICSLGGAALAGAVGEGDLVFGETPVIGSGSLKATGEVVYTAQGAPVALFHYISLDADCRPRAVGIRVVEPPQHGAVTFSDGHEPAVLGGKPIYGEGDPRVRCEDRLVATRDAAYAPEAGFFGHDRLVVEFTDRDEVFTDAIDVNVEALRPAKVKPGRPGRRR
jgi:hypothetical protein